MEVVKLLIMNYESAHGRANEAIKIAYKNNHMNVVEFLIRNLGQCVLNDEIIYWMLEKGDLGMIELLIEVGVNIESKNNFISMAG